NNCGKRKSYGRNPLNKSNYDRVKNKLNSFLNAALRFEPLKSLTRKLGNMANPQQVGQNK
ncbi:MAG: hypothetical protein ACXADU_19010, partial [Promethearchaeota archaeon]